MRLTATAALLRRGEGWRQEGRTRIVEVRVAHLHAICSVSRYRRVDDLAFLTRHQNTLRRRVESLVSSANWRLRHVVFHTAGIVRIPGIGAREILLQGLTSYSFAGGRHFVLRVRSAVNVKVVVGKFRLCFLCQINIS